MQLSREAIQRMFDNVGGGGAGGGGGSISPSILNSYASQAYVQENFVSIEFFNRLFKIHGASADILPNDTATTISHIEANYGFWTQSFLSAFGYNSSGGGGGGGDGSVTSVGLSMPTGFSVSGSPVTTSGTLTVGFASGYSLPTTAKQTNWDTAYGWGDHSIAGYATQQWVTNQGYSTLSMTNVWAALESSSDSNRKINSVHLPDLSATYLTTSAASSTYLTKTEAASTYLTSASLNGYVTIGTGQTITGEKTFNTYTYFKESIILDKQAQQYIQFNGGTNKVGYYGQGTDGSMYVYSQNPINWYTDINGHIGLAVWGNGNVGVGAMNPSYKLDVTGTARVTDSVIIGGGKIAWDSTNNALYVEKSDGTVCHFYSMGSVSAMGYNSSGGGGVTLNEPLASINAAGLGTPSSAGTALMYNGSAWTYQVISGSSATLRVGTLNAGTVNASTKVYTEHLDSGTNPMYIDAPDNDGYYVSFNYQQDYYDNIMCYMTDFYNVGLFGEDNNANETWRIMPDGTATFNVLNASTVKGSYIMMGNLARLRASGATVYLETRATTSSSWVVKETWS